MGGGGGGGGSKQWLGGGHIRPGPSLRRHCVTHWCTLFNDFSRKQACQNVHRWNQKRLGFKMSLPMLKSLSTAALEGKKVLHWMNSFSCAASAKDLYHLSSIRFEHYLFFGSDWLNKQPKKSSVLTDSTSLSFSPLRLSAPLVHNKKPVISSANRNYIKVLHYTKI